MTSLLFCGTMILPDEAPLPGRYRHYKGQFYEVMAVVRHSETEEWLVLYRALYGDYGLWVRPVAMFVGSVMHEGCEQARFVLQPPVEQAAAVPASIPSPAVATVATSQSLCSPV